jgi:hypothetical protein
MQAIAERYHAASRPVKKEILDEFTKVTGYHRKHAIRALKRISGVRAIPDTARQGDRAIMCQDIAVQRV